MRAVVFAYSNVGDRCLRLLCARGVQVALVVTHRDAAGETQWYASVAETAAELGLPLTYADDHDAPSLHTAVAAARPEVLFAFYFRHLLPEALLRLAPAGAFNMHGSLLPAYRGRAPTNWAVLRGETETGATLHEMVARADAGRIVDQQAVPILPDDTAAQVFDKVTVAAEQVLWRSLDAIATGRIDWRPNPVEHGSYVGRRRPEDGRIDWQRPASEVYDLIRAVAPPYPGAFFDLAGTRMVVARARRGVPNSAASSAPRRCGVAAGSPGLRIADDMAFAVCGDGGVIRLLELQANGRRLDPIQIKQLLQRATAGHPA